MAQELDELKDLAIITEMLTKHDKETRARMMFYLMSKFKPEKKTVMSSMKPSGKV